jgi:hypothetical protein
VPPFAHDARLNADFLRDRTRAEPVSCQQHYPLPLASPCGCSVLGTASQAPCVPST